MARKKRRSIRRYLRRGKRRGHSDKRLPLFPVIGGAVALWNIADHQSGYGKPWYELKNGNFEAVLPALGESMKWAFTTFEGLTNVVLPPVVGFIGSRIMSAVGVNKALKRVPMVGRYIKL
jgi:hypothetical protein